MKLRTKCSSALLVITRDKQWARKRMVYLIVANRPHKYKYGRSRIIYIGMTRLGANRLAASAIHKAREAFKELRGVKSIEAHIITCVARQALKSWVCLEAALLDTFVRTYGTLPIYNLNKPRPKDGIFRQRALKKLIDQFDHCVD